ncbi:MAG: hypothetical protein JWP06_564 [Candidatus Saccharibacteria bacterium]|nr:hypothetical protein [Candidatus Saccharibacteria bacterium]
MRVVSRGDRTRGVRVCPENRVVGQITSGALPVACPSATGSTTAVALLRRRTATTPPAAAARATTTPPTTARTDFFLLERFVRNMDGPLELPIRKSHLVRVRSDKSMSYFYVSVKNDLSLRRSTNDIFHQETAVFRITQFRSNIWSDDILTV